MDHKYLILPGCDDTNRGDQALIWETVRMAENAGYKGHYYMIATKECALQSKKIGIDYIDYILPHPSQHNKQKKDNRKYNLDLRISWAFFSLVDLLVAVPLLFKPTRLIIAPILGKGKKNTIKMYQEADAAFVKGGGFLHAYGGLADSYKIFFFLYHINLALSMHIPVYVMPNSYGPFRSPFVHQMVRHTLKKCKIVYSRESISQKMLKDECGINSILSYDLAMYLQKDEQFDAKGALAAHGISSNKPRVALTVRPYRFPGAADPEALYMNYKKSIAEFMIWLSEQGYEPVLVEHTSSDSYHEQDMICIREIIDLLPDHVNYGLFADHTLTCRQMKAIYAQFDYIVGTRFHSIAFSLMERIPCVAITYGGNKGEGIMKDMGLGDYTIPMDAIRTDTLIEKFKDLVCSRDEVLNCIEKQRLQIAEERSCILSEIKADGNNYSKSRRM